ncbi:protein DETOXIFICATION 53-like [Rhodamnia argentea]|uniref:Protein DETOXIFICATION n=1 Tax=Rhodamnia argentea TaxID=178133 RepID=A0A8B8Q5Q1_9MYRT|nr:protein DETOXIFICATION 53-like [Rhodamnia argentea]
MGSTSESAGTLSSDHFDSVKEEEEEEEEEEEDNDGESNGEEATTSGSTEGRFLRRLSRRFPVIAALQKLPLNQAGEELQSLMKIACPIVMTTLLIFSRSVISMLFLSHLGKEELAGGALALGFSNITGNSILKGLAIGMDPICAQAFGAKRWSVMSQTYQKTLCLMLLVCVPISALWLHMESIFGWLGQDPEITHIAQVYMVFSIPELFAQACLHPLRIFLRTQGVTTPLTIACVWSVILHMPINYFLVVYLGLGVKGVSLALSWNTINLNLGLLIYLAASPTTLKPWHGAGFSSILQGWRPLLALALPSCVSVCLEWWWYEIMLFLCGLISNPKASVAAMGILIQTTGLLYTFPFSLSSGLSARIGQALGGGNHLQAQLVTIIGIAAAVAFGIAALIFMIAIRSVWGRIYTDDPQVLKLVSSALPILGLCELGNSPQTASCGVLTGTARPNIGVRINLFSFYLVGLPVAVLTTFQFKIGFRGLWFGLLASQISCVCLMTYTLIQTDWKHQVKRADELTTVPNASHQNDLESGLLSDQ